jgi:hypothetical protein
MDQFGITEFRPGDEITSEKLNAIIQAAVREQVGGLSLSDPQGTIFRNPLPGGSGSGVQVIRFLIVELQCYACNQDFVDPEFSYQTVATGWVRGWPPGTSLESVPDSFMSTVTFPGVSPQELRCVSLMDLGGCWLNGPEDELLYRTGWAVYLNAERGMGCEYGEIVDPGSGGSDIVPRWEIMSLCPREIACGPAYGS